MRSVSKNFIKIFLLTYFSFTLVSSLHLNQDPTPSVNITTSNDTLQSRNQQISKNQTTDSNNNNSQKSTNFTQPVANDTKNISTSLTTKNTAENFLTDRPDTILQKNAKYPIFVTGASDKSYSVNTTVIPFKQIQQEYDAIIVGGGLAGLTSAVYLTQKNKTVLMLEKENVQGGLAAYLVDKRGFNVDRGAGYWTRSYEEQFQIFKKIGIQNYIQNFSIPEPIDVYLNNGILYGGRPHEGMWDNRTIGIDPPATLPNGSLAPTLPISFAVFKLELSNADKTGKIPNQPFEITQEIELDTMTASQYIKQMPEKLRKRVQGNYTVNQQYNKKVDGYFTGFMEGIFKGEIDFNKIVEQNLHLNGKLNGSLKGILNGNFTGQLDGTYDIVQQNLQFVGHYHGEIKGNVQGLLNGAFEGFWNGTFNPDPTNMYEVEKKVLQQFDQDVKNGKLSKTNTMQDVIKFINLYSRSALGTTTDKISAMAFANFYISELQTRYTSPNGTGVAVINMMNILKNRTNFFTFKLNSQVVKVKNYRGKVEVRYIENGVGKIVNAKTCIFSAQTGLAPKIVEGLEKQSPEQANAMKSIKYAHYSLHNIHVTNHPYREAYDTWTGSDNTTEDDYTDSIVARWKELHGYEKQDLATNYQKNPDDKGSVITLYHPLITVETNQPGNWYNSSNAANIAEKATERWQQESRNYLKQKFQIIGVTTNRWPFSIHIVQPGFFTKTTKILSKTFKKVIFGHSNLGTPAFEQALFRGHCAANKVLFIIDENFQQEPWSRCQFKH